jgi:hypothetical protein
MYRFYETENIMYMWAPEDTTNQKGKQPIPVTCWVGRMPSVISNTDIQNTDLEHNWFCLSVMLYK